MKRLLSLRTVGNIHHNSALLLDMWVVYFLCKLSFWFQSCMSYVNNSVVMTACLYFLQAIWIVTIHGSNRYWNDGKCNNSQIWFWWWSFQWNLRWCQGFYPEIAYERQRVCCSSFAVYNIYLTKLSTSCVNITTVVERNFLPDVQNISQISPSVIAEFIFYFHVFFLILFGNF